MEETRLSNASEVRKRLFESMADYDDFIGAKAEDYEMGLLSITELRDAYVNCGPGEELVGWAEKASQYLPLNTPEILIATCRLFEERIWLSGEQTGYCSVTSEAIEVLADDWVRKNGLYSQDADTGSLIWRYRRYQVLSFFEGDYTPDMSK